MRHEARPRTCGTEPRPGPPSLPQLVLVSTPGAATRRSPAKPRVAASAKARSATPKARRAPGGRPRTPTRTSCPNLATPAPNLIIKRLKPIQSAPVFATEEAPSPPLKIFAPWLAPPPSPRPNSTRSAGSHSGSDGADAGMDSPWTMALSPGGGGGHGSDVSTIAMEDVWANRVDSSDDELRGSPDPDDSGPGPAAPLQDPLGGAGASEGALRAEDPGGSPADPGDARPVLTGIGPTNALVVSRLRSNSKTARAPQFGKLYWGALMHKHREAETRAALAAEQRAAWGALGRSAALSEALAARVPVAQEELCGRWALTRVAKYLRCYWHCWPLAMDDRRWVAAEERAAWAAVQRSAVLSAAGAARAEAERLERRGRVSLSKAHAHGLRMRALAALETEEVEARARVAAAQRLQWHPLALRCVETAALDVRLETERAEERHRDDINGDLERVVCGNINFSSSQVVEISRNLSLSGSDLRTDADVDGVLAAILTGDVPRLRGILRARGSLINKPLNTGVGLLTPLMLAASCFQVEAARLLLQEGADCEAVALRSNGKTALDFAIISGHSPSVEMVEVLVDYGCPLRCALGTAASVGRLDVMDLLLFKGAWACYDVQQHGSLVIRAAQSGQGSVVTRAVEVERPSNVILCRALEQAMRCNSISAVSALLEAAEACNAVRKAELPDTLRYLYDGCMSQSYYHRVAVHVEDEHSLALLRERVQLHTVLERGFLHAASDGLEELVECLAEYLKQDRLLCTILGPDQNTALHLAAQGGHKAAVLALLDLRLSPDLRNAHGQRPVDVAAPAARLLLEPDALAVLDAVECGDPEALERALGAGRDPDARNGYGWTALMEACWQTRTGDVDVLLRSGADGRRECGAGFTAMLWAEWRTEAFDQRQGDMLEVWLQLQKAGLRLTARDTTGLRNLKEAALRSTEAARLLGYRRIFESHTPRHPSPRQETLHSLRQRMAQGLNVSAWSTVLPRDYRPLGTIEEWFLGLDHREHLPDTDSHQLLSDVRRFVVRKVAEGFRQAPAHIFALYLYTCASPVYRLCNQVLREGADSEPWHVFIYYLCQALNGLDMEHDIVLYRGIESHADLDISLYAPSTLVHWPSFSSASLSKTVAEGFLGRTSDGGYTGLLFMITACSAKSVGCFSHFAEEEEYLFPPNTEFRVKELHDARWAWSALFPQLPVQGKWMQLSPEEAAKRECLIVVLEECA